MVDMVCTIPQGQKAAVIAWLASKGVEVHKDADGVTLTKGNSMLGEVNSSFKRDAVTNALWFAIRFKDNVAAQIPDKPNYIPWRSDMEVVPDWPTYSVEDTDPDTGSGLGTYHQQGVGGLA